MATRLIILLLGLLYIWVIVATWPYRMEVRRHYEETDHTNVLERQYLFAQKRYEELKAKPNVNQEELLDAQEAFALYSWEKKDFIKAMELFQDIVRQRTPKEGEPYNERYVSCLLRLAGIQRDIPAFVDAERNYAAALDYDKKFFEKTDPNNTKIDRDLNNLGLLYYMEATSENDNAKREALMKKAEASLNDAVKRYQEKLGPQSPSEGISLWNLYLVERDLGHPEIAQD